MGQMRRRDFTKNKVITVFEEEKHKDRSIEMMSPQLKGQNRLLPDYKKDGSPIKG